MTNSAIIPILFYKSLVRLYTPLAMLILLIFCSIIHNKAYSISSNPTVKEVTINITQDFAIPVTQTIFPGNKTLIVWIPSEFGSAPVKQEKIAHSLSKRGVDVWHLDLHSAYFIQRNRNSVDKFQPEHISIIIQKATTQGYSKIILTGSAGAARPILRTARYWQKQVQAKTNRIQTTQHPKHQNILSGIILFHPSLYESRPDAGKEARYIPETYATNTPVYIIQPTYSTAIYRIRTLLKALRTGGGQVWVHVLQNIKDGFQFSVERHQRPIDIKTRQLLPSYMIRAIKYMSTAPGPNTVAKLPKARKKSKDTFPGLKPYKGQTIRSLTLNNINKKPVSIKMFKGEVLLVSFWASWCPPCVHEMPSINRLARHFKGRKFRVVSVNIGESKAKIRQFLGKHSLLGEILMDPTLKAYRKWKIYVIPSNFIIDKNSNIRYTSVGAVDWDTKNIRHTINKLIND
ncbi:hypothetical protein MNBD_GAMMA12-320 [hydrothermal vent metagenome]|uniref:Thioredoxin domain-containing protein n=1 Tax=hydrothermal vent metagenome TaxID=652676 RepID=A0A3B0Y1T7_9ZZZZ